MSYCRSLYTMHRRVTREVIVGNLSQGGVVIGGSHPLVAQSMITADTMETERSVRETLELVAAGSQLVRITAPSRLRLPL